MSVIDVRTGGSTVVHEIRFADAEDRHGYNQASVINVGGENQVDIYEGDNGNFIRVNGYDHAKDLIKALEKAIELGWLK